jgi:hypothetical protein
MQGHHITGIEDQQLTSRYFAERYDLGYVPTVPKVVFFDPLPPAIQFLLVFGVAHEVLVAFLEGLTLVTEELVASSCLSFFTPSGHNSPS